MPHGPYQSYLRIFLLLFVTTALSCCCGCRRDEPRPCIKSELVSIESSNWDNSDSTKVEQTSDTIPASAYLLHVDFYGREWNDGVCAQPHLDVVQTLLSPLLSFKCEIEKYTTPDSVVQMTITSTADFNSVYSAGMDLTTLFATSSASTYIDSQYRGYNYWPEESFADYMLFALPDSTQPHQFIVSLLMASGRVVSDTTQVVVLKK